MNIKKVLGFSIFLVLFMNYSLAFAAAPTVDRDERIYDFGGYLTGDELSTLQDTAAAYSDELEVDFVAVITDDNCGLSPEDYVSDFYQTNIFGYHETNEGVIMYINMVDRDIWVGCKGVMEDYFLDGRTDQLYQQAGATLNSASSTPYYDAIDGFLNSSHEMVLEYRDVYAAQAEEANEYADSPVPTMYYSENVLDLTGGLEEADRAYLSHLGWTMYNNYFYEFRMLITNDDLGMSPEEYTAALVGKNGLTSMPGVIAYYNISSDDLFLHLNDAEGKLDGDDIYNKIRAAMESGEYAVGDNAVYNIVYTALSVVNTVLAQSTGIAEVPLQSYDEYLVYMKSLEPTFFDVIGDFFYFYVFHPFTLLTAFVFTLIVTLILFIIQRWGLKSKPSALSYANEGVDIYHKVDKFVTTFTTKTAIPKDTDDSSRSSSSSGGPSGSGGKF